MAGPGDEIAAGAESENRLRSSHADRGQVIAALKDAFVQGRLTRDEFDLRVSKALATYAELDALTADIPAGSTEPQSTELHREAHNKKVIQRGTAAGAGVSMAFTATLVMVGGGSPIVGFIVVPLVGVFVAVLLAGLLTLLSWVLERGSTRQASQEQRGHGTFRRLGRVVPPIFWNRARTSNRAPGIRSTTCPAPHLKPSHGYECQPRSRGTIPLSFSGDRRTFVMSGLCFSTTPKSRQDRSLSL